MSARSSTSTAAARRRSTTNRSPPRRLTLADEADVVAGEALLANPNTPVLHAIADARDAQRRAHERTVH
jgi:hypothetical protein